MPARTIAAGERGQDAGRRQYVACDAARTRKPFRVACRRPAEQVRGAPRKSLAGRIREREEGAIRQVVHWQPMPAFGAAVETLGVERAVDLGGARSAAMSATSAKGRSKGLRICTPALEAGTMTGSQRGWL